MSQACNGYSASLSSSLRSELVAQIDSVLTNNFSVPASSAFNKSSSNKGSRRSLGVLGSLQKDISALIRLHSSSHRRKRPQLQQNSDIYAGEMVPDDDRPTRKSKSENRLYNFITRSLTRSRSRSRSRTGHTPPIVLDEPLPNLPNVYGHIDTMGQSASSKPTTRVQSRPLSSTTTATNTTITPGTPRPKKQPSSAIPVPRFPNPPSPSGPLQSRLPTSRGSTTRRKLHNLFGIPLSSPKKSSFNSSRQSSRTPSLDMIPPLPGHELNLDFEDNDPTPRPVKSCSPHVYLRSESPTPINRPKEPVRNMSNSSTNTSSTSTSSRFQRFFTGHKTSHSPSPETVSGPMRHPSGSSHHRRNSSSNNSPTTVTDPPVTNATGHINPPPPQIVHTPATPVRPERPGTAPTSASVGLVPRPGQRKNSIDSAHRYGAIGRSIDEGGKDKGTSATGSVNGYTRTKVSRGQGQSHRSTKHGSFDFERPGWAAGGAIQRTGSGGTTNTGTSGTGTTGGGWGRNPDGYLGGIRESAMGPGMAGVGTLQREASMKRAKERDEMIMRVKEEERRRRRVEQQDTARDKERKAGAGKEPRKGAVLGRHQSLQSPSRTRSPDEVNGGMSTPATETSYSLGKKRGGLFHGTKIGSKSNMISLGIGHGPFSFEPPVPSPTWSTGSTSTGHGRDAPLSISWAGEKGRGEREREQERVRIKAELERERQRSKDREKGKRSHSSHRADRAPVPVPAASLGHRSGTKGRSLDLGLELSWAPTTVKETALLPGFLGRSISGSSSLGGHSIRSVGGRSTTGSTSGGHETIEEENESGAGREVAEVFKKVLDDAGYAEFKKYVHRFDAHDLPFDGPTGIVACVERLLSISPNLAEDEKRRLLDNFVCIILQNT